MGILANKNLENYLNGMAMPNSLGRGRKIYNAGRYQLEQINWQGIGQATLKVQSESEARKYRVEVNGFNTLAVTSSCNCPYDWGGICKHEVAAILVIDKRLKEYKAQAEPVVFSMLDSTAYLPKLADSYLKNNVTPDEWKAVQAQKLADRVIIHKALNGYAECEITFKKIPYTVRLTQQEKDQIHTSCSCNAESQFPLCLHKTAVLLKLREVYGPNAFDMMKDWTAEKSLLLAEYGFSLDDDLKGKFDFKLNSDAGKMELIKKDPSIHKLSQYADWNAVQQNLFVPVKLELKKPVPIQEVAEPRILYTVTFYKPGHYPGLKLVPVAAKYNAKTNKFTHIKPLTNLQPDAVPPISEDDSRLIRLSHLLTSEAMVKYLQQQSFLPTYGYYFELSASNLSEEGRAALRHYEGVLLEELFRLLAGNSLYPQSDSHYNYTPEITYPHPVSPARLHPYFEVREDKEFVSVEMFVQINGEKIPFKRCGYRSYWVLSYGGTFYKIAGEKEANLFQYFNEHQAVKVKKESLPGFLSGFVLPLAEHCDIDLKFNHPIREADMTFSGKRLYLKEDEENLLLYPAYLYDAEGEPIECQPDERQYRFTETDGQITRWCRDTDQEAEVYAFIQSLHPRFSNQQGHFFAMPFKQVMHEGWLFKAFERLKAEGVEVLGYNSLKKLRYNPNRPGVQIWTSSGIDWFDVKVEISFGDQFVDLAEVRKALLKKENFVLLGDGTIGVLPEEWIEKYAGLFRVGRVEGDSLQISKRHFSVVDELYDHIDDVAVKQELFEKRQKLLNFKEIAEVPVPANVRAQLRDYQKEGFKWLHFLDEFGWGGCLADDMGLGKTLQILTFLQEQKNRFPQATSLIVLPVTLLYNWQAEAEKFCPDLRVHIYRGATRKWDLTLFDEFDLILTTYGTVRSDIEKLRQYEFHYVVLDESQAIKNPNSQVAKAVKLLKARNRLVMTGTPVENNTFDLYSQMEFLNPGLLGSQEAFRTEYATAIDKHRDEAKARELRRIIYPFMLKRTKEEVAKDLPDKTEIVLTCEMSKAQRKVYESFRESYRQKIVDKMAMEGKDKSSMLILEGLLKLRQICDSPALLSDNGDYGHESAKLEELVREIGENAGHHKILIFSQFLKMLDLVRLKLESMHIRYQYLDGSTTDRMERVQHFQENDQCRVFLMSLKAGGVGLNLTSADYVYLIDPWWNPAVEQQAIDRTHRIGQTQKVFAYKMICKDTVEEKILTLQEKKKDIARDLISTEAGFIKKLTQDDIVGLFS